MNCPTTFRAQEMAHPFLIFLNCEVLYTYTRKYMIHAYGLRRMNGKMKTHKPGEEINHYQRRERPLCVPHCATPLFPSTSEPRCKSEFYDHHSLPFLQMTSYVCLSNKILSVWFKTANKPSLNAFICNLPFFV